MCTRNVGTRVCLCVCSCQLESHYYNLIQFNFSVPLSTNTPIQFKATFYKLLYESKVSNEQELDQLKCKSRSQNQNGKKLKMTKRQNTIRTHMLTDRAALSQTVVTHQPKRK